jgi:hypothetical protein
MEMQLLSHTRDVCVVEVGAIKVIQEVHEAAKGEDEEIELLHQLALARGMLVAPQVLNEAVRHCSSMSDPEVATGG